MLLFTSWPTATEITHLDFQFKVNFIKLEIELGNFGTQRNRRKTFGGSIAGHYFSLGKLFKRKIPGLDKKWSLPPRCNCHVLLLTLMTVLTTREDSFNFSDLFYSEYVSYVDLFIIKCLINSKPQSTEISWWGSVESENILSSGTFLPVSCGQEINGYLLRMLSSRWPVSENPKRY